MRLGEGPKEFKSNATMHFSNANMSAVLQCLIAILVLAGFATRCGAEEMPEEVFRKVSKTRRDGSRTPKEQRPKSAFWCLTTKVPLLRMRRYWVRSGVTTMAKSVSGGLRIQMAAILSLVCPVTECGIESRKKATILHRG